MPREQRRVGFQLPPEVFEQLLGEVIWNEQEAREESFWERLRSYYDLSPVQGDGVICDPSFVASMTEQYAEDPPRWVSLQPLRRMQCLIIAGPGREEALLGTLREIERLRDAAEDLQEEKGLADTT